MIKRKKKNTSQPSASRLDRYVIQANYYLTILEKRIRLFRRKLNKLEKIKYAAAKKGQKELLIEALRSEKILKRKLKNYLGMHQSLQQVVGKITDVEIVKGMTDLFKEGGEILREISREISPEAAESAKLDVEEAIADISETENVLGEPIALDDLDEEDLDEEAERLIAEASLPDVSKEEDIDIDNLEKELKDIMIESGEEDKS